MIKPTTPQNESARLESLQSYDILDTPAEPGFDELTFLASHLCKTPISLLSLTDQKRQWFKSKVGLSAAQVDRDLSFCAHAILQDNLFVVEDAHADARFSDNPLVASKPAFRFYAGAPLRNAQGFKLGTLCVFDRVPRKLSPKDAQALDALAHQAMFHLEARRIRGKVQKHLAGQGKKVFSNLSHELRTPISGIMGMAELLLETPLTEQQKECVDAVVCSSDALLGGIDQILKLWDEVHEVVL